MRIDTLDILRCPFCGGRLELVTSMYHRHSGDDIRDGILGCQCCIFPVIDGIPVMHLLPNATAARAQVESGQPRVPQCLRLDLAVLDQEDGVALDVGEVRDGHRAGLSGGRRGRRRGRCRRRWRPWRNGRCVGCGLGDRGSH